MWKYPEVEKLFLGDMGSKWPFIWKKKIGGIHNTDFIPDMPKIEQSYNVETLATHILGYYFVQFY